MAGNSWQNSGGEWSERDKKHGEIKRRSRSTSQRANENEYYLVMEIYTNKARMAKRKTDYSIDPLLDEICTMKYFIVNRK